GYCILKLGGVLPRRVLMRPGTIRLTWGQLATMWLSNSSRPRMRPCWRLMRPNFMQVMIVGQGQAKACTTKLQVTIMAEGQLKVGDMAPDFELMDQDKTKVHEPDFRGSKNVMLL